MPGALSRDQGPRGRPSRPRSGPGDLVLERRQPLGARELRRREAGEVAEVADEVGLVGVAALVDEVEPVDRARAEALERPAEAQDADELLGRDPEGVLDDVLQAPARQAELPRQALGARAVDRLART